MIPKKQITVLRIEPVIGKYLQSEPTREERITTSPFVVPTTEMEKEKGQKNVPTPDVMITIGQASVQPTKEQTGRAVTKESLPNPILEANLILQVLMEVLG